jgi:hypothetical protein
VEVRAAACGRFLATEVTMTRLLGGLALATSLLLLGGAPRAAAVEPQSDVDLVVSVEDVRADGCSAVEATLRNHGTRELRDVRLAIECIYHWPDEHHPGDENPGRAWTHVVPGPIAPGARESVRSAPPGAAPSAPGRFEPRVRVLGFQEAGG